MTPFLPFTEAELADWLNPSTRWSRALAELQDHGAAFAVLAARLATLEAQLADETRGTPEARERAQERRNAWKGQLGHAEAEAGLMRLGIASLYFRLPEAERRRVAANVGETVAPRIAWRLWEAFRAGERPSWMCPF